VCCESGLHSSVRGYFHEEIIYRDALHFSLKKSNIVHAPHDKVNFLGFHLKVPKKSDQTVRETRKNLNFKRLRHRIIQQKKVIEDRYNKSLLTTYDSIIKSKLKRLGKGEKTNKNMKIKQLVIYDAAVLHEIASSNNKKWDPKNITFKDWFSREIKHLKESWIHENLLKKHSLDEVITTYKHFINAMQNALSPNLVQDIQLNEVKRIIASSNYKQMHVNHNMFGRLQSLSPQIYAPI
jgi:hypothetical protein